MRLLNLNIIKLAFCLVIGIIIGQYGQVSIHTSVILTCLFSLLFLTSFIVAKNQFIKTIWFGLFTFLLTISIGVLITHFHNQKNFSQHYSNKVSTTNDSLKTITFRVREILTSTRYYHKYIVDIIHVDKQETKGKTLLNVKRDSTKTPLKVDAIYITRTPFCPINQPLNPHQFNYKSYLEKQYIYHQLYGSRASLYKVSTNIHTLFGVANNIRDFINTKLEPYNFNNQELAIINALILGQRQDVDKTTYSNYVNSGTIHVLAVSGLHIGILMIILSFVLKPLEHFKHGKLLKTALLVFLLWGFALITGLSASVTRSVTMFSIIAIGLNLKRPTNTYNILAISIFVILLFKPMFLFDIGFQLSYLAVFAIVAIDPYIYNLWRPKYWLVDYCWHTLSITLSAQLIIVPISLFYFHQFPGLFFISNMVVVPLSGIILGFGLFVIVLASINTLPQFVADLFGYTIRFMNHFVAWVSHQNEFVFKDIPFNATQVLFSYLLMLFTSLFLIKKKSKYLTIALISCIGFQSVLIFNSYSKSQNEFVVFHKSKGSLIGQATNHILTYSDNIDSANVLKNNTIRDYAVGNHIKHIKKDVLKSIYKLNTKTVFIVDSLGVYKVKSFSPDYVLLTQSPKINLNRLIDSIKPKHIIADGSNYKSYLNNWEIICRKRKLPFHQTGKKGAFIITY